MKKMLFAAAVALGTLAGTAQAAVVDFNTGSLSNGSYTQNGFTFSTVNNTGNNSAIQTASSATGNSTPALAFCSFDGGCTAGTSINLTNGSIFSIKSIDAVNWQIESVASQLRLVGTLVGGGTISETFALSNIYQTFSPSNFVNLSSLNISSTGGYAARIDNLNVTTGAVPEPASWAMMILGMGAIGYSLRSAKRRSNAKFDAKIKRMTAGFAA